MKKKFFPIYSEFWQHRNSRLRFLYLDRYHRKINFPELEVEKARGVSPHSSLNVALT